MGSNREFGDFQTPPELVEQILEALGPVGEQWPRVLEPTCGLGNFIAGLLSLEKPPREIQAFELQPEYVAQARRRAAAVPTVPTLVTRANLFDLDLRNDLKWEKTGPLLVIGNPPWVTNAEIGGLNGTNVPVKTNVRGLQGLDAMTGESNFDLAEAIWIKLITELAAEKPTIALLCKTSVARNVLRFAHEKSLALDEASIRRIPADRWFRASVDACLFIVKMGSKHLEIEAKVYAGLKAREPEAIWGVRQGRVVNLEPYERSAFLDGVCPFSWRQGVKHDAASVMELAEQDGRLVNRLGRHALVEAPYVYPLLKGADLFREDIPKPQRFVLVTQKRVGEDTEVLKARAPKLWGYLTEHASVFARRKSSIFRKAPRFALFGIGEYSFAPYKVAVAALYKIPRFRVVGPVNRRPVMLDDTCYFVACTSLEQAVLVANLLNHPLCLDFLAASAFAGAKRIVTKKLLSRIDVQALFRRVDTPAFRDAMQREFQASYGACGENTGQTQTSLEDLLRPAGALP
jgi:hypothetical protein